MLRMLTSSAVAQFYDYQVAAERTIGYMVGYTLAMFAALFLTSFGIRISMTVRAYHPNVDRLYRSALAMWITLFISKLSSFLYQLRGYNHSRTVDTESAGFVLLQIAAFFRYFYYFFGSATPLAVTIERAFATYFLSDYEKTSRAPVYIVIVSTNAVLGLIYASSSVFFNLQLITVVIIPFANVIICFVLLNILYRYNIIRIRRLNIYHRDTQYTLSKRYQLRENIRILSLLMKMIYAVLIFIALIVVGLTVPAILEIGGALHDPLRSITEFCFSCNPLIVIPMTAIFIPEFKRIARASLFHPVQMARSSVDSSQRHVYYKKSNQADIYFDQFKKSMSGGGGGSTAADDHYPVAFIKRYT